MDAVKGLRFSGRGLSLLKSNEFPKRGLQKLILNMDSIVGSMTLDFFQFLIHLRFSVFFGRNVTRHAQSLKAFNV